MKKNLLIRLLTFSILFALNFDLSTFAQVPGWQWAKSSADGGNNNYSTSVSSSGGNVFITGYFTSPTITFGATTLTNAGSTNGLPDIYLTKYDGSGNVLWAKSAGSGDYDYAFHVCNDASGNAYVVGRFQGASITFGSTTLTNAAVGKTDIFVVKYDGSGNVLWAKNAGGTKDDGATGAATDASGNLYVTGWFKDSAIVFGSTTLINASKDTTDIFLTKYDSNGNVLWAKRAGGTKNDYPTGVATYGSTGVFITGYYYSSPISFSPLTLINSGNSDDFIAKYDNNGNILWATKVGGSDYDYAYGVATDPSGNVYQTGVFYNFLYFGSTLLTSAGGSDIFLAKYDGNGTGSVLWAKRAGGTDYDYTNGITTDAGGNIYLTGYYSSYTCAFDTTTLTNPYATSTSDIFIAKYNSSGTGLWAKTAGGSGQDDATGVCIDATGNGYVAGYYNSPTMAFGSTTLTSSSFNNVFLAKLSGVTDVEELEEEGAAIDIYPNPSQGEFVIRSSEFMLDQIEISNVLGETVYEDKNINRNLYIANHKLPGGIYFLRITIGKNVITKRIIVNR
jgi:hypothetical protein